MHSARRAVSRTARVAAARTIARIVASTFWLGPGKRIGIYASMPREIGTAPLIDLARARGCHIFLPRISSLRHRTMRFVRYDPALDPRGTLHSLGMHEPDGVEYLGARFLDTLFIPALAFDRHGARLGQGLGFYDRALAFRHLRRHWRGPRLVGLAYSFQVAPQIPVTATDVCVDTIVTDRGIDELLAHEDRAVDLRGR